MCIDHVEEVRFGDIGSCLARCRLVLSGDPSATGNRLDTDKDDRPGVFLSHWR